MNDTATIRRLLEEDAEAVVALYAKAANVEPRLGPVALAEWRRFTKLPQNYGCRDFRVAQRRGRVIGLAESSLRDQGKRKVRFFKLVVDPAARRQGIGSALLDDLLSIADPPDDLSLQTLVDRDWRAGMAFVSALGFAHIESEIIMQCAQLAPPISDAALGGVSIERVNDVPHYAVEVARIHNTAYAGDGTFRPHTPNEMADVLDGGELWMASKNGRVLGFCHLEPEPHSVWLESIAVDPTSQSRGLGSALAYRALAANNVRPDRPAGLGVSSKNKSALSVYRRIGFLPRHEKCRFGANRSDLMTLVNRRKI